MTPRVLSPLEDLDQRYLSESNETKDPDTENHGLTPVNPTRTSLASILVLEKKATSSGRGSALLVLFHHLGNELITRRHARNHSG